MKIKKLILFVGLLSLSLATRALAQSARFFRIEAPWPTKITSVSPAGIITWTNGGSGTNCIIQTATRLGTNAWADYAQVPVTNQSASERLFDPATPPGMALIPAGSFTMGDNLDGESAALPLHTVYVSAFYMDKFDVTEALWAQVYNWATNHGYSFDNVSSAYNEGGYGKGANYPVVDVNWYDVVKWCNARSEMEGRVPAYYTDASQTVIYRTGDLDISNNWVNWTAGYRLPTEAEWEKAARGGMSGQRFPWGNTINESQANYYSYWYGSTPYYSYDVNSYGGYNTNFNKGNLYTSPVNYFAPNGYGLYDMAGNVLQWCWDWYGSYGSATQTDPRGPASGSYRVLRGGGWNSYAFDCRAAVRYGDYPASVNYNIGFRSVLPPGQ